MNAMAGPTVVNEICAQTQGELVAFLDGELPPPRKAMLETHLAACPACAAECASLQATLRAADALPNENERDVDVTDAVLRAIVLETSESRESESLTSQSPKFTVPFPPSDLQRLLDSMREMQAELAAMRREMTDLRRQLSTVRGRLDTIPPRPIAPRLFSLGPTSDWAERER